jgi:hypothetical protein
MQALANLAGFAFLGTKAEQEGGVDDPVDSGAFEFLFAFALSAMSATTTPPTALMVAAMTVAVAASKRFLPTAEGQNQYMFATEQRKIVIM